MSVLINPQMIIEVLSPSTEAFDRGAKFSYYKSIPSLREYLLIATQFPHVSHFTKQDENVWINRDANGMGSSIMLPTFDVELQLSEIYVDVVFPELPDDLSPDGR